MGFYLTKCHPILTAALTEGVFKYIQLCIVIDFVLIMCFTWLLFILFGCWPPCSHPQDWERQGISLENNPTNCPNTGLQKKPHRHVKQQTLLFV